TSSIAVTANRPFVVKRMASLCDPASRGGNLDLSYWTYLTIPEQFSQLIGREVHSSILLI
ncbi:MAG: hypothetical protein ABI440_10430, partial [Casimicrobiaceae bacterium]